MKKIIVAINGLCLLAGLVVMGSFFAANASANDLNLQEKTTMTMQTTHNKNVRKHRKHRRAKYHRRVRRHHKNVKKNGNTNR